MKNRKIYLLLLCAFIINFNFFFQNVSASETFSAEWVRTWGGNQIERANTLAVDTSNNVYIAGSTNSFGAGWDDMCLVKYSSLGVQLWNRTWGGNGLDDCNAIALDSSDNIYLAGYTRSFGAGIYDMCLVKYSSSGVQLWNRTWGGNYSEYCYTIVVDSLNHVYIAGQTKSFGAGDLDMCLVKYDSSGVQQWNTTWGGSDDDGAHGVALDSLENIYVVGYSSFDSSNTDICLVKYDKSGVLQWNRSWSGRDRDIGYGISLDSTDNIYLVGKTRNLGEDYNICLVKYTSSGILQWNNTISEYLGSRSNLIALDSSDNIYIPVIFCLLKFDKLGGLQWNRTCCGSDDYRISGVVLDSLENIYLGGAPTHYGTIRPDMCLIKITNPSTSTILGYKIYIILILICIIPVILIKKCYKLNKKI